MCVLSAKLRGGREEVIVVVCGREVVVVHEELNNGVDFCVDDAREVNVIVVMWSLRLWGGRNF